MRRKFPLRLGLAQLALAFALILAPPLAAPAGAQESGLAESDAAAIRQVIENQLAAFQRDAAPEAFGYASPTIQQKFQSAETFMSMVRSGYPQVYRPQEVEFRDLSVEEVGPVQDVFVIGPDGQPAIARYVMQRQPDGSWRIDGCFITPAADLAV